MSDPYRATCRPPEGCRQCGEPPVKPKRFYCSDACRHEFEADHFWGTARLVAQGYGDDGGGRLRLGAPAVCARLSDDCDASLLECNHITPVNGDRQTFGCQNHQSNLEMLCHGHHLEATAEQRAAGLIGAPKLPAVFTTGSRRLKRPQRHVDAVLPGFAS